MSIQVSGQEAHFVGTHRELIYPLITEAQVVSGNGAWGGSYRIIPVATFDDEYLWGAGGTTVPFNVIGAYVNSSAGNANPCSLGLFRVIYTSQTALFHLSGNGEADESLIDIADTSGFLVGDIVWITDATTTDGQIGQVDVIDTNVSLDITDVILAQYDPADSGYVYLIGRPGTVGYGEIVLHYAAANTKEDRQMVMHEAKAFSANDGVVARAYGVGGANTLEINLILDDGF